MDKYISDQDLLSHLLIGTDELFPFAPLRGQALAPLGLVYNL